MAILLHETSALCVLNLIGMGLTMTHAGLSPLRQFQLYQWHKSVGITVLALTVLSVALRLTHRPRRTRPGCRRGR
ncbi:cytochrome b [Methylobacterium segetis]|uniref:cytochrome b n=1 Tax=Methylobacterium segetis TaxID=2488750 RepID=UPI001FE19979|nr:cytochrome b/b6 domain-containing protein [Methylobacterium segetis]